jgi:hypothetical protein
VLSEKECDLDEGIDSIELEPKSISVKEDLEESLKLI